MEKILVIEVVDAVVSYVKAFDDSADAEKLFLDICRENIWDFDEYTQEDIDAMLDDGYEKWGDNSVSITHISL
jgi:hypothetical protein